MKIYILFEKGYTFTAPIINSIWLNRERAIEAKIYKESHDTAIYFVEEFETSDTKIKEYDSKAVFR